MIQGASSLPPMPLTYRFGRHLLDVPRRMLLTGAERRTVPEKLFRVLLLLLEANGQVVSRHAFFNEVWTDEEATLANLTQHIFLLRTLLGERAGQNSYIVTVPGRGYRLAGGVEKKAGLTMKGSCERCLTPLFDSGDAFICSYECTFCSACSAAMSHTCPNCGGELVKRPARGRAGEPPIS